MEEDSNNGNKIDQAAETNRTEEIDQAVEEFSEEKKKLDIALKAAKGNRDLAEKYIRGEIKDIAAVKGSFNEQSVNLYGLFIFFVDLDQKSVDRTLAVISFDKSISGYSPFIKWSDLQRTIVDLDWSGKGMKSQSEGLKNDIQSLVQYDYIDELTDNIKNNNEKEVKLILNRIIKKALSVKAIDVDIGIEMLNRYLIDLERPEEKKEEEKGADEEEEVSDTSSGEVLLDGTLVIAPIKGINITKLTPGMRILVKLPDKTSKDKYYLNFFNAIDEEKIRPVTATVNSVDFDDITGYLVIAEITPGFIVKCIEQAQINIMTPDDDNKEVVETKSRKLIVLILVIGGFLLLFGGLYLILLFKGII